MWWRRILFLFRFAQFYLQLKADLLLATGDLKVIVGASATSMVGWISTEYPCVDLTDRSNIFGWFQQGSVKAILAEHVWEHLTQVQAENAAKNCFDLLAIGGYLRIAVPDGNHPDPAYIDAVKPGGSGDGSKDHKLLFTIQTLSDMLKNCGFTVMPLEWFDESGSFNSNEWRVEDGMVTRSSRFDSRNVEKPLSFTSLIVDAYK
jgi:predicted SAM-dependent methyltransferase